MENKGRVAYGLFMLIMAVLAGMGLTIFLFFAVPLALSCDMRQLVCGASPADTGMMFVAGALFMVAYPALKIAAYLGND